MLVGQGEGVIESDAAFNATVFLQGATLLGLLGGGVLADVLYRRTKASRLWLMTASLTPISRWTSNMASIAGKVISIGFSTITCLPACMAAHAYSPCMHRADAETVSFSWAVVSPREVRFLYLPVAPCRHSRGDQQILARAA